MIIFIINNKLQYYLSKFYIKNLSKSKYKLFNLYNLDSPIPNNLISEYIIFILQK